MSIILRKADSTYTVESAPSAMATITRWHGAAIAEVYSVTALHAQSIVCSLTQSGYLRDTFGESKP